MESTTTLTLIKAGTTVEGVKAEAELSYSFGVDLQSAVDLHTEEAVYGIYLSGAKNSFGNAIRSSVAKFLKLGTFAQDVPAKVSEDLADWKPGVKRSTKKDPVDRFLDNFDTMTDERRNEVLDMLRERAAAKAEAAG